jgi:hypothetical protein
MQKLSREAASRQRSAIIRRAAHIAIREPCVMNDEVAVPADLNPRTGTEIGSEALTARDRELERSRRADAARITALVQYMLHRGADGRDLSHH